MKWRLLITPKVQSSIRVLPPETKRYIRAALEDLTRDPWIGKPLRDELAGLYSLRAKRFRIVYRIQRDSSTVAVIAVGRRGTIYEEAATEAGPY